MAVITNHFLAIGSYNGFVSSELQILGAATFNNWYKIDDCSKTLKKLLLDRVRSKDIIQIGL
ncbi:hypothetical protein C7B67_15235 [filamentous cyanobacterium Phorm 6]|nr:hypothetical protein C7B67_15235 [filamentous cyanobacterium Phorm 6]